MLGGLGDAAAWAQLFRESECPESAPPRRFVKNSSTTTISLRASQPVSRIYRSTTTMSAPGQQHHRRSKKRKRTDDEDEDGDRVASSASTEGLTGDPHLRTRGALVAVDYILGKNDALVLEQSTCKRYICQFAAIALTIPQCQGTTMWRSCHASASGSRPRILRAFARMLSLPLQSLPTSQTLIVAS